MGGKKKHVSKSQPEENVAFCNQSAGEKKFVNLLLVYTIYKQRFRRLTKEDFETILGKGAAAKQAVTKLCEEFMQAKNIPNDIDFSKNIGYLNVPRMKPLIALLAERADYKLKSTLVKKLNFKNTKERFREKFSYLLVYGFWYLGRVISDSLSVKDQVNRGNMFNFTKGDLGFWWAGVRILDWNYYVKTTRHSKSCLKFVINDPPKYRFYTSRAIINMNQDPKYFLTDLDWDNYMDTIKQIDHTFVFQELSLCSSKSNLSALEWPDSDMSSDLSSLSTGDLSVNTFASTESVD